MNKQVKQIVQLLALVLFIIGGQAAKAQTKSLDIKEAIRTALSNNYSLQADSLNIVVAEYKKKELSGWFLPQVNMASKTNYNLAIPNQMLPGQLVGQPSKDLVPVKFGTRYDAGTGVEVTQTIYRKDLRVQMRSASLNKEIAGTQYNLSTESLVYQVAAEFYSLQSKAENIRTTTADYLNMKDILSIAKAQYENGVLKRIEYESLQINVANKQSQLNQLMVEYKERMDYFKYLLGLPITSDISISESIATSLDMQAPAGNHQQKRNDIFLSKQLISSKELEIASIRAEKLPVFNSFFKYNYQSQFNKAGGFFDGDYKSSTIGFSVSVSLFDGNRRRNRIQAAQTQLQQLKWESKYQEQLAETQVSSNWATFSNNRLQYQINKENLVLAEKVFTSRKALYAEGVSTLIELLDAEKELTQARNLYMQSLINVQTGRLNVFKSNGTLLTEFLKSI